MNIKEIGVRGALGIGGLASGYFALEALKAVTVQASIATGVNPGGIIDHSDMLESGDRYFNGDDFGDVLGIEGTPWVQIADGVVGIFLMYFAFRFISSSIKRAR